MKELQPFSLILPARNEAKNLPLLFRRIAREFPTTTTKYEIILIDDHSSDDTFRIANLYTKILPLKVLRNGKASGKGAALQKGLAQAKYPFLVTMDADNQYAPRSVRLMVEKISEGFDLVIAKRVYFHMPYVRVALSRAFSFFICTFLLQIPGDTLGGLKVIRRSSYEKLEIRAENWSFDLELVYKARQANMSLACVKAPVTMRSQGISKLSPLRDCKELIQTAWELRQVKTTEQSRVQQRSQSFRPQHP